MTFDISHEVIEESRWTRANTWTFVSFAIGVMMQASFYSWAYLATGWYTIAVTNAAFTYLLLVWPGIFFIVGIVFMGVLADRIGRKTAFFVTMGLYFLSALGILLAFNYYLVLVFIALSQIAGGGETNTVIAAIPEMFPTRIRAKVLYLVYSFVSIGPAIFAAIDFLSISSQITFQRELVAASAMPLLVILLASRYKMPESIRWLEAKGRKRDAGATAQKYYGVGPSPARSSSVATDAGNAGTPATTSARLVAPLKSPSISLRLVAITCMTIANVIGFGLFVFSMGPIYFSSITSQIIFVSDAIEAVVTIAFAFYVDRISRRWNIFGFYIGTLVMAVVIAGTVSQWSTSVDLFWAYVGVFNVFLALGYAALNTLKGEIWPTGRRALYTGAVRIVAYTLNVPATLALAYLDITGFAYLNVLLWVVGVAGALIWLRYGRETGRYSSVTVASQEENA